MPSLGFLDKIATYLIIVFFIFGVYEATTMTQTDIPIYQKALDSTQKGDWPYLIDMAKMGWGWSQIIPIVNVDTFPWYIRWYGWYTKLILPSGFLPLPGWQDFPFIGIVLLSMLPLAIYLKRHRRAKEGGMILGLPLWFFALIPIFLLALYPAWCWIHLHWLFIPGAMSVFNLSEEAAYQIWISFGEKSEAFSWFFVFMTFLGVYKGGKWGSKFKKF